MSPLCSAGHCTRTQAPASDGDCILRAAADADVSIRPDGCNFPVVYGGGGGTSGARVAAPAWTPHPRGSAPPRVRAPPQLSAAAATHLHPYADEVTRRWCGKHGTSSASQQWHLPVMVQQHLLFPICTKVAIFERCRDGWPRAIISGMCCSRCPSTGQRRILSGGPREPPHPARIIRAIGELARYQIGGTRRRPVMQFMRPSSIKQYLLPTLAFQQDSI